MCGNYLEDNVWRIWTTVRNSENSVLVTPLLYNLLQTIVKEACENNRLGLADLAAGDVSPGGTSAPQRQKFHTNDVKSVQILVRSSDWST